jgi:hypothetical protein
LFDPTASQLPIYEKQETTAEESKRREMILFEKAQGE